MTPRQIFSLGARILIGGVLIYSGASKALVPGAEFAAVLATYRIFPAEILPILAQIWPWVELLVGTYIFFGYFTSIFAALASAMFTIFLLVLGSALVRGIDLTSCGCFGVGLTLAPRTTLGLDLVLLVLSITLTRVNSPASPLSADSWINR